MKRRTFLILALFTASCSSSPTPIPEAPVVVEDTTVPEIQDEAPAAPAADDETDKMEQWPIIVPIGEMAPHIPWLEMDKNAVPTTTFIGINSNTPPFDNALVRKAFRMAIDGSESPTERRAGKMKHQCLPPLLSHRKCWMWIFIMGLV